MEGGFCQRDYFHAELNRLGKYTDTLTHSNIGQINVNNALYLPLSPVSCKQALAGPNSKMWSLCSFDQIHLLVKSKVKCQENLQFTPEFIRNIRDLVRHFLLAPDGSNFFSPPVDTWRLLISRVDTNVAAVMKMMLTTHENETMLPYKVSRCS